MVRCLLLLLLIGTTQIEAEEIAPPPRAFSVDNYGDRLPEGAFARLGTLQYRDTSAQYLSYTEDGKYLMTADYRANLRYWDAATGKVVRTEKLPFGISQNNLSSDGRIMVRRNQDKIEVWDAKEGYLLRKWDVDANSKSTYTSRITLTQDGRYGCFVETQGRSRRSGGGSLRKYDLQTGESKFITSESGWGGSVLAMTPDAKIVLFTTPFQNMLSAWDTTQADVRELWRMQIQGDRLAISPNGKWAVVSDSSTLRWIDVQEGKLREDGPGILVKQEYFYNRPFVFSHDSTLLAVADMNEVILIDVETGKEKNRFPADLRYSGQLLFLPDNKSLITLNGLLQRWDLESGKPIYPDTQNLGHANIIENFNWSGDSQQIVSHAGNSHSLYIWDVAKRSVQARMTTKDQHIYRADFTYNGEIVGVTYERLLFWNAQTGEKTRQIDYASNDTPFYMYQTGMSSDRKEVHLVGMKNNRPLFNILSYAFDDGKKRIDRELYPEENSTNQFTFDGLNVHFHNGRRQNVHTGQELLPYFLTNQLWSQYLAFTADRKWMAVVPQQPATNRVMIWDQQTAKLLTSFGISPPSQIALHPQGRILAVHNSNDGLSFYDIPSGKRYRHYPQQKTIRRMLFSPDGRTLATAESDSTMLLWDVSWPDRPRPEALKVEEEFCFLQALFSSTPALTYPILWRMIDDPQTTLSVMQRHIQPAPAIVADPVPGLIAKLDQPSFRERELATRDLLAIGDRVRAQVMKVLQQNISPEKHDRLERILADLQRTRYPNQDEIFASQVVIILERIATAESVAFLERLAKGADHAPLTMEAKEALSRIRNHRPQ